jgi:hypothetical protein
VLKLIIRNRRRNKVSKRGCIWHMATMVSSKRIVGVMGWRALVAQLYSPTLLTDRH